MDIVDKLQALIEYYNVTRGVGHTATMLDGARHRACIVLASNMRQVVGIGRQAPQIRPVSLGANLDGLRGLHLPLAIDNGALWTLMAEAWSCIQDLRKENVRLRGGPDQRAEASARSGQTVLVPTVPSLFGSVAEICRALQED